MPNQSDVAGQMNNNSSGNSGNDAFDKFIKAVDKFSDSVDDFEDLVRHGFDPSKMSQSSARLFRDSYSGYGSRNYKKTGNMGFLDRFEYELGQDMLGALKKSNFGGAVQKQLENLAKGMGGGVKDIPDKFASALEKELFKELKNTKLVSGLSESIDNFLSGSLDNIKKSFVKGVTDSNSAIGGSLSSLLEGNTTIESFMGTVSESGGVMELFNSGMSGIASSLPAIGSALPPILAGLAVSAIALHELDRASDYVIGLFKDLKEELGPVGDVLGFAFNKLLEGTLPIVPVVKMLLKPLQDLSNVLKLMNVSKTWESIKNVGASLKDSIKKISDLSDRYFRSLDANLESQKKRYKDDIETIVRAPFDILKEAAQTVQSAWDANLKYITSANLYTKSDVQDLMQNYAQRLSNEGLTAYVSGSEITSNLAKVIQQGLSGAVAEEFAYQATLLNSEIPTQDFFSMASTYSSVVANAVKDGKSQSDAIAEANKTLKDFANNLLYAGRVASGGMSTGLTNASSLYTQSVQIAQAANSSNVRGISGVLTAVSGIIGAIAPDLANSITDAVVKAATGGNDSSIVALRSLAGGNASNTEFLKNLAENPKRVFYNLFTTLDKMFTDSSDAYMEKAEGYAQLFGLSAEAFQRIDFKYLADTIYRFDTSSNELAKNVTLLKQGQTTLTKEQQVNAQINQYMLDEGLSYVLDNEVARSIQEHMWDEQIARELQETTYGVEIVGTAMEVFNKIEQAIVRIYNFMHPLNKLVEPVLSIQEAYAQHKDLQSILELGKVGAGNSKAFYNLTTTGKDLNLTKKYVELLGGESASWGLAGHATGISGAIDEIILGVAGNVAKSTWNTLKDALGSGLSSLSGGTGSALINATGALGSAAISGANYVSGMLTNGVSKLNEFIKTAGDYVSQGVDFDTWLDKAQFSVGVSIDDILEATGATVETLSDYYEDLVANKESSSRITAEEEFWNSGSLFWNSTFNDKYAEPVLSYMSKDSLIFENYVINTTSNWTTLISGVGEIEDILKDYVHSFTDYFIDHNVYYGGKMTAEDVQKIQAKENGETGTAIMELAKILTSNSENLEDPMVQTNALLAQILLVATTIMNKDGTSALSLADTVTGLSMGIVKKA